MDPDSAEVRRLKGLDKPTYCQSNNTTNDKRPLYKDQPILSPGCE